MSIAVSQLNASQLTDFILDATSGSLFSGMLGAYTSAGGYLGSGVVYTTGGAQSVATNLTLQINPTVPYSGGTGTSPSQRWVSDSILYYVNSLSGTITGSYVLLNGNQTINDYKVFTGAVGVGAASLGIHAATLAQLSGASGILAAQISAGSVSLATLQATSGSLLASLADTGAALIARDLAISGALQALISAGGASVDQLNSLSGFTTGISGALQVLINAGGGGGGTPNVVTTTGNELIGGFKQFTGSPLVPNPSQGSGAANVSWVSGVSGVLGGFLATTGSNLYNTMTGLSGQSATNYATKTSLTDSGIALTARDLDISGALQAQIAGANGTQVSVTGGGTMGFAAFTGQGGLNVYTIGSTVYVSGGAGGGGGDVTQAQLDSLSGYSNATFATITNLVGTGATLYAAMTGLSGQGVTDYATKLQLTNTGVALGATILSASGALQDQIAAGGSQVRVSGSSTIAIADISGAGTTSVTYNGTQVIVSGAAGAAGGGTATLARWTALDNSPTATAFATFDTANNIPVLAFDAVTGESGIFSNVMPQGASFSNGIDARIFFRAAGGTTGAVVWNLAFESGNSNIATDGWTTGINSSGAPANGTLGMQTVATISFSSAEIGGLTAGDFFRTRLSRVSLNAADTMTGDAQFTAMEIRQR